MRKRLLWLVAIAVALLAITALALIVRMRRLGDALVDDVLRYTAERTRPVHRGPPIGTTYGACLGPLLDANRDAGLLGGLAPVEVRERIDDVLDGGLSVAALSEDVQADLAAATLWLDQALACTRAPATGGDNAGMGPFAGWDEPRWQTPFYPHAQAKIAALSIRADVARGDADRALERCADVLAMLRDAVPERGLIGAMHGDPSVVALVHPCGAAIESATPAALRRFIDEVGVVQRGFPSFQQVLELERVEAQFLFFGRELNAKQRARLSPTAQTAAVAPVPMLENHWYHRPLQWLTWPAVDVRARRLAEAATSPDRARLFEELDRATAIEQIIFSGMQEQPGHWERYAQRYEARGRGIDLLESAARVSLGEAPLPGVDVVHRDGVVVLAVQWVGEPPALLLRLRERPPAAR